MRIFRGWTCIAALVFGVGCELKLLEPSLIKTRKIEVIPNGPNVTANSFVGTEVDAISIELLSGGFNSAIVDINQVTRESGRIRFTTEVPLGYLSMRATLFDYAVINGVSQVSEIWTTSLSGNPFYHEFVGDIAVETEGPIELGLRTIEPYFAPGVGRFVFCYNPSAYSRIEVGAQSDSCGSKFPYDSTTMVAGTSDQVELKVLTASYPPASAQLNFASGPNTVFEFTRPLIAGFTMEFDISSTNPSLPANICPVYTYSYLAQTYDANDPTRNVFFVLLGGC